MGYGKTIIGVASLRECQCFIMRIQPCTEVDLNLPVSDIVGAKVLMSKLTRSVCFRCSNPREGGKADGTDVEAQEMMSQLCMFFLIARSFLRLLGCIIVLGIPKRSGLKITVPARVSFLLPYPPTPTQTHTLTENCLCPPQLWPTGFQFHLGGSTVLSLFLYISPEISSSLDRCRPSPPPWVFSCLLGSACHLLALCGRTNCFVLNCECGIIDFISVISCLSSPPPGAWHSLQLFSKSPVHNSKVW